MVVRGRRHNISIVKIEAGRVERIRRDCVSRAQCSRPLCRLKRAAADGLGCAMDVVHGAAVGQDETEEAERFHVHVDVVHVGASVGAGAGADVFLMYCQFVEASAECNDVFGDG